jgi:D-serine deaminase-like pyridoxal phosphate-dependent protein
VTFPAGVLGDLPTPCLIVDAQAAERNIQRAAACVRDRGIRLRPHFKAHKCTTLIRRQLGAPGCAGVTCQTSWEALTLARAGFRDILVAAPVMNRHAGAELAAAAAFAQVTIAIDDPAHVTFLADLCARSGARLVALVELDVGLGRCGLPADSALLIDLARSIQQAPGLSFGGLQAYEGHVMLREDPAVRRTLCWQALAQVRHERDRLAHAGISCDNVSGGGTGILDLAFGAEALTEIQAGSYVLMDASYGELGLPFEPAIYCACTVVSRHSPEGGVLNAGLKSVSVDQGLPVPTSPGVSVLGLSDEHARIALSPASPLEPGDTVLLIPSHLDPTVNLHDTLFAYDALSGELMAWPVDGRRGPLSAQRQADP